MKKHCVTRPITHQTSELIVLEPKLHNGPEKAQLISKNQPLIQLGTLNEKCNNECKVTIQTNCQIGQIYWNDLFFEVKGCSEWIVISTALRKMVGENKYLDMYLLLWLHEIRRSCKSYAIQCELDLAKRTNSEHELNYLPYKNFTCRTESMLSFACDYKIYI